MCRAFEELWAQARDLDAAWIADYAARARDRNQALPPGEVEPEPLEPLPEPRDVQREARAALAELRAARGQRALVVLATGLGKTLVAVLDYARLRAELGRRPRLLFIAHRREILTQAVRHLRRLAHVVDPELRVGWYAEDEDDLGADAVFASVARLARSAGLRALREQRFDYTVIDEVHHAAATSYRRILDALDTGFLLGLTATPERADERDILHLFGDREAYGADIGRGIALGHLVPFAYFGVRDDIDYESIPWRNRRFDAEQLSTAAQTEARMQTLLRAWRAYPATRTLVFCCSIEHARYVRDRLRGEGLRVDAVYAATGSDDRETALRKLVVGELDALCAVDVFNEGVDLPALDRVVLLRPTESSVVFLQQIGRGLRTREGKERLVILDFVGNHRVFLDRMRALLSLGESPEPLGALRRFLGDGGEPELPPGCSVELELEAKAVLERLLRVPQADVVAQGYLELRSRRGARPTAGAMLRQGYDPAHVSRTHDGWFRFVTAQGDLTDAETAVADAAQSLLMSVEHTEMTRCFKMVLLEALLELDGLATGGVPVDALARRSWEVLERTPDWLAEVPETDHPDGSPAGALRWERYWRKNPIAAWTTEKRARSAEFRLTGDRFEADLQLDEDERLVLDALLR
ncbi:MAG TPA: DEAD/DEAH box helicase [Polyangiaceae bacterium]|nr:DEAD/DEAH box helicase [Polyangiaceae bacterium]